MLNNTVLQARGLKNIMADVKHKCVSFGWVDWILSGASLLPSSALLALEVYPTEYVERSGYPNGREASEWAKLNLPH